MTKLADAIKHLANRGNVYDTNANVVSVDKTANICVVTLNNTGEEIVDVKLLSIIDNPDTKFVIYPVVGSDVSIVFLDNDMHDAIVVKISEVDEILLRGDQFGGLIKVAELVTKLNATENKLNDLIGKWNSFCTVYVPGSPSTLGLPATLTTSEETTLTPTVRGDIENVNIKHG